MKAPGTTGPSELPEGPRAKVRHLLAQESDLLVQDLPGSDPLGSDLLVQESDPLGSDLPGSDLLDRVSEPDRAQAPG